MESARPLAKQAISRTRLLCLLISAAVVLHTACGRSGAGSQTAQVDQLFAPWSRTDSPGCAIGISRNGAILYEHAYGKANLELNVPNTPETVFAIASITKAFTAMSVLLAAQQGKLSLDDEVQKYIPDWRDRDDHITIRHLLTHTSGIRDAFGLLGWAPLSESAGDYNEAIARILALQRGVNFPPGTEYQYNNVGYNLLATILKRHGPILARIRRREYLQAARHGAYARARRFADAGAESSVWLHQRR